MSEHSTELTVDPKALQGVLDGRWADVRGGSRQLSQDAQFTISYGDTVERQRADTLDRLRVLAESDYARLGFPTEYGGLDDVGGAVTAFEMLAFGDLSLLVKAGVQWGLFGGAILHLGTERHHRAYLTDLIGLKLLGCFAMTETGHGSDVANIRTTATFDPESGEFVIDTPDLYARKEYIGNAARDGHAAVVFAQLVTQGEVQGVHAFVVAIRDEDGVSMPGVTIEDCGLKAGLNGVDNGRLYFDHVRVPRDNLLNRYGDVADDGTYRTPIDNKTARFFTMLGTLVQGRISVAGGAGSATKLALTIAIRYGDTRRQFSAPGSTEEIPVLDYLAHQRRLLPALAKTYALHFAQSELVAGLNDTTHPLSAYTDGALPEEHPGRRELESRAAGIKAIATWHATRTIQDCREACGGAGYLTQNRLPGLKADTDVFTTFEGDNTVLLQLVAKDLLTGYRDHFGELDLLGTARFVTDQAVETVLEKIGGRRLLQRLVDVAPGTGDESSTVLDRDWYTDMIDWREKHLLETAARRLRRAADADDPFAVFNAAQDHLLQVARAHVDAVLLHAFLDAIDTCADGAVRDVLATLCDLYALSTIEADRGWFWEHGRLTQARSKAIIGEVNALCARMRPIALDLVAAFAIPDKLISAALLD